MSRFLTLVLLLILNPAFAVSFNNYGTWGIGSTSDTADVLQQRLVTLSRYNFVTICENAEWPNDVSGWSRLTSISLKQLNSGIRVYRYYGLIFKGFSDSDWYNPSDTRRMNGPLTRLIADANDWWLRDVNGNVIESGGVRFYDVGKPGFKEAYLHAVIDRNAGKGFDGILLDCWSPSISQWVAGVTGGTPLNTGLRDYPTDIDWQDRAWRPFITYVTQGLRSAGYIVMGNCAGEWTDTSAIKSWQRSTVDGTVYEQWAVNWDGSLLPASTIDRRIRCLQNDPLETWVTDAGLKGSLTDYDQKHMIAYSAFLMGTTGDEASQCYGNNYGSCYGRSEPFWKPLWDFDIGTPAKQAVKVSGRYIWTRSFTGGRVCLNLDTVACRWVINGRYVDPDGNVYSKQVTVPPKTALILKKS